MCFDMEKGIATIRVVLSLFWRIVEISVSSWTNSCWNNCRLVEVNRFVYDDGKGISFLSDFKHCLWYSTDVIEYRTDPLSNKSLNWSFLYCWNKSSRQPRIWRAWQKKEKSKGGAHLPQSTSKMWRCWSASDGIVEQLFHLARSPCWSVTLYVGLQQNERPTFLRMRSSKARSVRSKQPRAECGTITADWM